MSKRLCHKVAHNYIIVASSYRYSLMKVGLLQFFFKYLSFSNIHFPVFEYRLQNELKSQPLTKFSFLFPLLFSPWDNSVILLCWFK
jgi:hypothetical protein